MLRARRSDPFAGSAEPRCLLSASSVPPHACNFSAPREPTHATHCAEQPVMLNCSKAWLKLTPGPSVSIFSPLLNHGQSGRCHLQWKFNSLPPPCSSQACNIYSPFFSYVCSFLTMICLTMAACPCAPGDPSWPKEDLFLVPWESSAVWVLWALGKGRQRWSHSPLLQLGDCWPLLPAHPSLFSQPLWFLSLSLK